MQRCVGLPCVGRPAGNAFCRRACPRALLRTDPDQNQYSENRYFKFKVYPTDLEGCMVIRMVIAWLFMVIGYM